MPLAKIGDIQIHYEEYGEGPPLIMILGLGQDTATWKFQISDFSEHFRLIPDFGFLRTFQTHSPG
jgi:pimeloyl-ACP methyl ester carboxylesterase